jgi:hypothetical protein
VSQKKHDKLYLGRAGHLAVMSDLLMRGWNVAIPEVDTGDDIFVVQDDNGAFRRVQVKTSSTKRSKYGFSATFNIPLLQLIQDKFIPLDYAFIVRYNSLWSQPIFIQQDVMIEIFSDKIQNPPQKNLSLIFSFQTQDGAITSCTCSNADLSKYIADYSHYPKS